MGLRFEELEGMVLPLISIDEFEPKTGTTEEVIVVAFFCRDELPAIDLDEFLDKSVIDFLDSEVSPNPNEEGYYLVFIEFKRQPNFWMKLFDMVKDIENVSGGMDWKVQPYLVPELYDLYDPRLQQVVIAQEDEYVPKAEFDNTMEGYFKDSRLDTLTINEDKITFGRVFGKVEFDLVDFDITDHLVEKLQITEAHIDLLNTSPQLTALRAMLGESWDVSAIEDYYFINKAGEERSVVVRRR
jgi:hypothetical protein